MQPLTLCAVDHPAAALLPDLSMPWYGYLISGVALALPAILRELVILLLGAKALERTDPRSVAQVLLALRALTARTGPSRLRWGSLGRLRSGPSRPRKSGPDPPPGNRPGDRGPSP
jgi:hypothetical protein